MVKTFECKVHQFVSKVCDPFDISSNMKVKTCWQSATYNVALASADESRHHHQLQTRIGPHSWCRACSCSAFASANLCLDFFLCWLSLFSQNPRNGGVRKRWVIQRTRSEPSCTANDKEMWFPWSQMNCVITCELGLSKIKVSFQLVPANTGNWVARRAIHNPNLRMCCASQSRTEYMLELGQKWPRNPMSQRRIVH